MIDLEQILVIGLGSLVLVNFFAALALTIDWWRVAVHLRRFRKYWRVTVEQRMTDRERRAVCAVVHGVRVWLILYVAWTGW
jgi:hypothetical protein